MPSSDSSVELRDVSFQYDAAPKALFSHLSVRFPPGFSGIVGANGAGKTTLVQLAIGVLEPDAGIVQRGGAAVCCAQRTDAPPPQFGQFLNDFEGETSALRGRLRIEHDFLERWHTLSHGERKRAQIGHALWRAPDILAIDEPTNHIDAEARRLLIDALQRFRGVGLIVSHDRELLDALCTQCVWLEPPRAEVFAGGFTKAQQQRAQDRESAQRERDNAVRDHDQLQREIVKRREQAARSHRDRSKRGLALADHDARARKNLARVSGKDGQAGRLLRQMDGRAARAQARLAAARVDRIRETGAIWLPGSRSHRDPLLLLEPGELPLGGGVRRLRYNQLLMRPDSRIAITGANGLGKSTLVELLRRRANVPPEHLTFLPQEVDARLARAILDEARGLPNDRLGHVMNIVGRLGSDPARLLRSREPSPGEVRKLLLSLGMARSPHLIIMDEPTNHLDLPSIEALEDALAECPCGLLLVSHDERFLEGLVDTRWRIDATSTGDSRLQAFSVPR